MPAELSRRAKDLCRRIDAELAMLASARSLHDTNWQEAGRLVQPSRAEFTARYARGALRRTRLYDSTAEEANEVFAAGVHGMMMSRAQRWFFLQPLQAAIRSVHSVRRWLEPVHAEMYAEINGQLSGFHMQIEQWLLDLGAFGTAVCYIGERESDGGPVFLCVHPSECYFSENHENRVDTMIRKFDWPVDRVIAKFGKDRLSAETLARYEKGVSQNDSFGSDHLMQLLHVTLPKRHPAAALAEEYNVPMKEYVSAWIVCDGNDSSKRYSVLRVSGYNEFPWMIGRMMVRSGETYGTGPGVTTLPENRMLQEMERSVLRAAQKMIDPPLQVPDDVFIGPIRTSMGAINFYRASDGVRAEPLGGGERADIGVEIQELKRNALRRRFYNDAFETLEDDGVNVKAAWVVQKRAEKLRRLSGVFARIDVDALAPAITRVFEIMRRAGRFPEPPPEIVESGLGIEYQSPLARAQRSPEVDDVLRLFELAAPAGQVDPQVWDELDLPNMLRLVGHEMLSVPAGIFRDPEEVQRIREQRAQEREAMAIAEMAPGVAKGVRDVAAARRDLAAAEQA